MSVRDIPMTTDKIDDDVSVLVARPSPRHQRSGPISLLINFCFMAEKWSRCSIRTLLSKPKLPGHTEGPPDTIQHWLSCFPAWGIQFSVTKVLADPLFATQVQRENDVQSDPTILSVTSDGINKQDALGAAINDLLLPFAGAFTGTPADGLKEDVLVKSTNQAGLVDMSILQAGADAVRKELKSDNTSYPIAIRLSGKFKTAFPNGKPEPKSSPEPSQSPKPDSPSTSPTPKVESLKEGQSAGVVILVGDSDFAYDAIAGRAQQVLTQTVFVPSNGNLNFIQSCVEQLAGDSDLIGIRSRSSGNRPFVVVNKMEAAAEQKYQSKIDELEDNLNQTRQKLASLQTNKQTDQKTLLSPEQQAEIKKFQENEATVSQELKQVRKNLRQEIDSLQNTVKWIDIAGMAVIVTLVGLTLAFLKRRKRAAR